MADVEAHTTALGCTLRVYTSAVSTLSEGVMLNGTMEQPGDGRSFEVYLSDDDRVWLANALLAGE